MRYVKVTLICGFLAALAAIGLYELGAFRALDTGLAAFIRPSSPSVVGRVPQYLVVLFLAFGITWTTIDIGRIGLKVAVAFTALVETIAAVWVLNLFNVFFSPFPGVIAILTALGISLIYAQSDPGRRKRTINQLLGDRVSKQTFQALLDCDVPLKFDGEVREASVLVCEIFNHDILISTLRVNDYVAMTNSFLRNAADFLVERGGYLDECDGESLRVIFGAPLPDTGHAVRACESALDLLVRLDAVNQECQAVWGQMFDYRIGINSGEMVAAAYGSRRLGTFSVAGEPVEFARRLCSANTVYGSRVLVGSGTFNLAETSIEVRPMELIQRHPEEPDREEVYELLGRHDSLNEHDRARRDLFWKGVVYYREQRWVDAAAVFRQAKDQGGSDGPIEFYLRRIEQLQSGLQQLGWSNAHI